MPMTRFLYAIILIVVFSFVMGRRNKRQQAMVWKGQVTQIKHQRGAVARDESRRDNDWVTIWYRTDDGHDDKLKIRMQFYRQLFAGLQPGDRLVKKAGTYMPRRETPEDAPVV